MKLSRTRLLTKEGFDLLQWRCLAVIELLIEAIPVAEHFVSILTQEMHPSVFLHFPVIFISLASSLTSLSREYINHLMLLFCRLRTFSHKQLIHFPPASHQGFPELPFDTSLEVDLREIGIVEVAAQKPVLEAIDFRIVGRPQTQLRGRSAGPVQKPKSSLDSLGF